MTKDQIEGLLERVRHWPLKDQEELAEHARDIAARQAGLFHATHEELDAIKDAEKSGIASDSDIESAFDKFRSA